MAKGYPCKGAHAVKLSKMIERTSPCSSLRNLAGYDVLEKLLKCIIYVVCGDVDVFTFGMLIAQNVHSVGHSSIRATALLQMQIHRLLSFLRFASQ